MSAPATLRIPSTDAELEARWDLPSQVQAVFVMCHPHPQHGGTMSHPLLHKVTKQLVAGGCGVLRFNFRGVGSSSGEWGDGHAEVDDVGAAVAEARRSHPSLPLGVGGWSFGAAASLIWQGRQGDASPWVGIAPPVASSLSQSLPDPTDLASAPRLFVLGDRDQFVTESELSDYAESVGGEFELFKGSDHFFYFREQALAETISAFLGRVLRAD
ncbi:MAG: alpha/beta hydrolase [Acidimicrobiia bacterium]|nr:alpha/beta hydrolase [Acidimicrobiia bacterium]MDH3425335.1 alpha/beta hydrolase [Acidimicrobiia bacterium]